MSAGTFALLGKRRFGPFFLTQFFGAFNDNVFKNALVILIAYRAAASTSESNTLVNVAAGLFILPFFLFSASAGQLADKYEKSRLIRRIKLAEIAIMVLAALGFWRNDTGWLIAVLFLMGAQSAFFGPVKYGLLPQYLHEDELVGGNGLVEMGTFLAILLGTILGGVLIAIAGSGPFWVALAVVSIALAGYLSSRGIPVGPAAAPALRFNFNPFSETWRNLAFLGRDRVILVSVLGISWFWCFGATYLAQLPNYTRLTLYGTEHVVTLLLALFSIGIGVGSVLCDRLSRHHVETGLIPFGASGLTVFSVDLYFAPHAAGGPLVGAAAFLAGPGGWHVAGDIVLIGLFGGFYIVPLYALIQARAEPTHRSRVIAANNIVNALFMVFSAVLAITLLKAGLSIPQLFLVVAGLNVVVIVSICLAVPEFWRRFLAWSRLRPSTADEEDA
ncbi:MAG: MFS transporter [Gammaproteobacteria bacterium]